MDERYIYLHEWHRFMVSNYSIHGSHGICNHFLFNMEVGTSVKNCSLDQEMQTMHPGDKKKHQNDPTQPPPVDLPDRKKHHRSGEVGWVVWKTWGKEKAEVQIFLFVQLIVHF